ncbi:MAG: hypothetical protein GOV02_03210 [Candidatus Aenigmarchaeota archaeon]|nr:hypothetical protein [Candidatus Aenigmarchaeota archaeon]
MDSALFDAINSIQWALLLKLAVVAVLGLYLKKHFDNFASYMMFRSNKDLGKNVKVLLDGREGFITQVSWRFIYVEFHDKSTERIIPITKWTSLKWEVCKNGKDNKE